MFNKVSTDYIILFVIFYSSIFCFFSPLSKILFLINYVLNDSLANKLLERNLPKNSKKINLMSVFLIIVYFIYYYYEYFSDIEDSK